MAFLYFEIDKEMDLAVGTIIDEKLKEVFQLEEDNKYSVVLHNDPINEFDFVIGVIKEVFSYSTSKAVWLMFKAHFSGKSILWTGAKKKALGYQSAIRAFGPDPRRIKAGAKTLKVTVEKQE